MGPIENMKKILMGLWSSKKSLLGASAALILASTIGLIGLSPLYLLTTSEGMAKKILENGSEKTVHIYTVEENKNIRVKGSYMVVLNLKDEDNNKYKIASIKKDIEDVLYLAEKDEKKRIKIKLYEGDAWIHGLRPPSLDTSSITATVIVAYILAGLLTLRFVYIEATRIFQS